MSRFEVIEFDGGPGTRYKPLMMLNGLGDITGINKWEVVVLATSSGKHEGPVRVTRIQQSIIMARGQNMKRPAKSQSDPCPIFAAVRIGRSDIYDGGDRSEPRHQMH